MKVNPALNFFVYLEIDHQPKNVLPICMVNGISDLFNFKRGNDVKFRWVRNFSGCEDQNSEAVICIATITGHCLLPFTGMVLFRRSSKKVFIGSVAMNEKCSWIGIDIQESTSSRKISWSPFQKRA
jgi:hypothetical protein